MLTRGAPAARAGSPASQTPMTRRWGWLALAVLLSAALLWTHRYQYEACDTDGCVAIHRWTGTITFREALWTGPPPAEGSVVGRVERCRPRARRLSRTSDARPLARFLTPPVTGESGENPHGERDSG